MSAALELRLAVRCRLASSGLVSESGHSELGHPNTTIPPAGLGFPADQTQGRLAPRAGRLQREDRLGGHALDLSTELTQPLVDALVATVDLRDAADLAATVGAQRGDQHRHAGPDVG
jgi:hypothetical protein